VKSIISRRIQDYKKKLNKVQHFGDIFGCFDTHDHDAKLEFLINLHNPGSVEHKFDNGEYLQYIWDFIVEHFEEFTSFELDYITTLYDKYEETTDTINTSRKIASALGFKKKDQGKFDELVREFTEKLKEKLKR
jgi:hypothetical protein